MNEKEGGKSNCIRLQYREQVISVKYKYAKLIYVRSGCVGDKAVLWQVVLVVSSESSAGRVEQSSQISAMGQGSAPDPLELITPRR